MYRDPSDWLPLVGHPCMMPRAPASDTLRVEIPRELVQRLMEEGHLAAADLHCLDRGSKQRLQQICLDNCARDLRSRVSEPEPFVTPTRRTRTVRQPLPA